MDKLDTLCIIRINDLKRPVFIFLQDKYFSGHNIILDTRSIPESDASGNRKYNHIFICCRINSKAFSCNKDILIKNEQVSKSSLMFLKIRITIKCMKALVRRGTCASTLVIQIDLALCLSYHFAIF